MSGCQRPLRYFQDMVERRRAFGDTNQYPRGGRDGRSLLFVSDLQGRTPALGRAAPMCGLRPVVPEQGRSFDFTTLPVNAGAIEESRLKRAYGAFFNFIAPIYENWIWYQLTLNLSGAGESSIASIARFVGEALGDTTGSILDVACGTATYGRRIASSLRSIYGVDLSLGMLRQGRRLPSEMKASTMCLSLVRPWKDCPSVTRPSTEPSVVAPSTYSPTL